ncbi:MMPL family transporter [Plantactinospora sp. GCM10030261]|uniref:MMPL family transporter n=1 Tax=Plantactinospora sp. GCM10030261 TaxID=3273420 RepID=UPI00361D4DDF
MDTERNRRAALARGLARLVAGRRTRFAVLTFWLVLAGVAGPLAGKLAEVQNNDQLGALPASSEAQRYADQVATTFPERDALVAVAVYVRDGGLTEADRAKVAADRTAFTGYADGGRISPPVPSADGAALLLSFPLAGSGDAQSAAVGDIRDRLAADRPDGLRTALTGSAGADDDLFDAFAGMDATLLVVTALAVALLLIVTYRSPVLWLLPLLVVGVASQVTSAIVYLLARHAGLTVDMQSQSITTILVFGVGVDYALLLIARYREELHRHADRRPAMVEAVRRTLPAVAASAATVGIGLLCLLAADLPSSQGLGPVAAVGVAIAFATMMTLLPAVLVVCGRWVFWPFVPRVRDGEPRPEVTREEPREHRVWRGIAAWVGRRPRAVWIGTLTVLVALLPGIGLLSIGLPGDESFTREVGSVTGQRMIERHYPAGLVSPAEIVVAVAKADQVAAAARTVPGVAKVAQVGRSTDGGWVRLDAVLAYPAQSDDGLATVDRLRAAVHAVPEARALVGGETAATLDVERTAWRDNRVVMPLVLTVVFGILLLVLRAVVAPLVLLGSVVISYGAALGLSGLILHALGHPRLWDGVPLQTFLFLVALGVDYTIFLMTRPGRRRRYAVTVPACCVPSR